MAIFNCEPIEEFDLDSREGRLAYVKDRLRGLSLSERTRLTKVWDDLPNGQLDHLVNMVLRMETEIIALREAREKSAVGEPPGKLLEKRVVRLERLMSIPIDT